LGRAYLLFLTFMQQVLIIAVKVSLKKELFIG
jgi:hypothetical protein